ncbi:MAG: prepilin-type N-terminal cleavage/methylation domain-containing protein [Candidatus Saccharibacteria bacterium]|nr:prepilin-type N-terminal cleavage/methylation domain-containing protein [Candidatus Saccharibacteria bacterium]
MKRTSGFTIVEIIIAIAVIAMLAAIGVVAYNKMRARAMDAKLEQEAAQLAHHLDAMVAKHGSQDDVVTKLAGFNVRDVAEIRQYLNLNDFKHIKVQFLFLKLYTYLIVDSEITCHQTLSDSCKGVYEDKDAVYLQIMTDESALENGGRGTICESDGTSTNVQMSILYHSHAENKEVYHKIYTQKCRNN